MQTWFSEHLGPFILCWAEPFEHVVLGLASIVGGLWVFLRLYRERAFDSALAIDIHPVTFWNGAVPLTFVEVILTNAGKVKLQAKPTRATDLAYEDRIESLKFSCGLKLKKFATSVPANLWIDWFDPGKSVSAELDEINLLNEYEDPQKDNRVDFWMEPGEVYHLNAPVALSAGLYLAKVTFIGASRKNDKEFWTRTCVIKVDEVAQAQIPNESVQVTKHSQ